MKNNQQILESLTKSRYSKEQTKNYKRNVRAKRNVRNKMAKKSRKNNRSK